MKQIDKTFYSLCEEIDDLKEAVEYWKTIYETERATNNKMLNDNLETAKQGVANALRFALSSSDDESGNLVISKENRKDLAENWIGSDQCREIMSLQEQLKEAESEIRDLIAELRNVN